MTMGGYQRMRRQLAILSLLLLAGCAEQQSPQIATTANCPAKTAGSGLTDPAAATTPRQITFYGDILPILSSQETGKVYKCTTCHADYGKIEKLSNVLEVDRVIESMTVGRMPRGGTKVPKESIQLFRDWQLQGFQAGTPQAAANGHSENQTATPAASNCP